MMLGKLPKVHDKHSRKLQMTYLKAVELVELLQ